MEYEGEQLRFLLALLRLSGLGASKLSEILENCSDFTQLFDASDHCQVVAGKADWALVEKDLKWLESPDCYIVHKQSTHYPSLLKEIHSAPPILFVQGNLELLTRSQIAIVGSRNPTALGCDTAMKFARHFSCMGFTITSGLAIGIDGAAHKGALLGEGSTIGVLGHGLDRIYPAAHQKLAQEILEKAGALVCEFPIGIPPAPAHFPKRNRIISGLSVGTLVVEAALNSGSLITAKLALEQGREVFAIPGSIHNPLAKGCHALIREGAKLVETAEDVLEELQGFMKYGTGFGSKGEETRQKEIPSKLESSYVALLTQIGYECTPIDSVINSSGLTARKVSGMLLELELKGYVKSVPGGYTRLLA